MMFFNNGYIFHSFMYVFNLRKSFLSCLFSATSLWPDQWQHTFSRLRPSTEYSLVLLADNVSKHTASVQTSFGE